MFNINDTVKVKYTNIYGKVTKIVKNKNETIYYIVLPNNTKLQIKEDKIEKTTNQDNTTKGNIKRSYNLLNNDLNNELMIRHQNKLEAIENLDKFISDAIVHNEKRVKIIHGRHGGILRDAVHNYLNNCNYVDNFKLADEYEGSIGVTIVNLK